MALEDRLSSVLSEFARTMLTDFPIQTILDRLVERIVDVVPVTGAGVTLIAAGSGPHHVAASDGDALLFERLQSELGQGPCLTAYESGIAVAVPDLAAVDDYPDFGPAAVAAGLAAVFTFPLQHVGGRLGALDLYRDTTGPLEPQALHAAQTLADVTTAYLLNAQARDRSDAATERFRQLAQHDALTGLPNRLILEQRLEHAAARARRSHATSAVVFADLDRFKAVNDTHGHDVGDDLLRAVAQRLAGLVRPGDTLARYSGDEFVFLCEDLAHVHDVAPLARRIEDAFATPFDVGGRALRITASIGIAYSGPGDVISQALVSEADLAMYAAKRAGGGRTRGIDLRIPPPARTRPRTAGLLIPDQQPARLDAWALERSCRDRLQWLRDHPALPFDLLVQVSMDQVGDPGFCATIAAALDNTGMEAAGLVLEVRAQGVRRGGSRAERALAELCSLGVRLALHDFAMVSAFGTNIGTGTSDWSASDSPAQAYTPLT